MYVSLRATDVFYTKMFIGNRYKVTLLFMVTRTRPIAINWSGKKKQNFISVFFSISPLANIHRWATF